MEIRSRHGVPAPVHIVPVVILPLSLPLGSEPFSLSSLHRIHVLWVPLLRARRDGIRVLRLPVSDTSFALGSVWLPLTGDNFDKLWDLSSVLPGPLPRWCRIIYRSLRILPTRGTN